MEQELTTTSDPQSEQAHSKGLAGLLEAAHEALAKFELDTARKLLVDAAETFPDSEKALFEYGYFLYEQGDVQTAEAVLQKAVALAPDRNAKKYFTLAQISSNPAEIHALYTKGLQIIFGKLEQMKHQKVSNLEEPEERLNNLHRLAAQGFCGLAQLEATSAGPYFESFDGAQFLAYIQKAMEIDPYYLEAYSQLSLYYFNIQDETLCRKTLKELVARVHELEEKGDGDLSDYGPGFFVPIVRMMIEGEIWEDGVYLMEVGLQSNNKDLEANYFYAFCLFKAEELDQAADVCNEMEKLNILKSEDDELIQGFIELKQEIQAAIAQEPIDPEHETPDSDNDWQDDDN